MGHLYVGGEPTTRPPGVRKVSLVRLLAVRRGL